MVIADVNEWPSNGEIMGLALSPTHSEIFPDEKGDIKLLLEGIGSEAILCTLAVINAFLDENTKQQDILEFILRRQPLASFKNVVGRFNLYHSKNGGKPWQLFSRHIVAEFMMWVIENSNDLTEDCNAEEDFKIFKSYLLIAQQFNERQTKIEIKKGEEDRFLHLTWPLLSSQWEFNYKVNLEFQIFRTIALINELLKESAYTKYVISYQKQIGIPLVNYLKEILRLFENRDYLDFHGKEIPRYFFKFGPDHLRIFQHLFLNLKTIKDERRYNLNYQAIKKYPLLEHKDRGVTILNWTYLKLKIYNGFLFDFYYTSGIKSEISSFADFKSKIGELITEQVFFRCLLKTIFNQKYHQLHFPEEEGMPDAYLRMGKRIFLFELKDYIINSSVIVSNSFEEVKKAIDKRFVNGRTGIKQLNNYIEKIKKYEYTFDPIIPSSIKKIEVYPIIIYTDPFLGLLGVNSYINEKFVDGRKESDFKEINDIALINMEFLFENLAYFGNLRLDKLIKQYFKRSKKKLEDMKKKPSVNKWFEPYLPFGYVTKVQRKKRNSSSVDNLIKCLDLNKLSSKSD